MDVELYELNMNLDKEERRQMQQGGIGDSRASLHARSFLLDRKRVFIGSLNLDARSIIQNTEIGVVFKSEEIAKRMAEGFDDKIDRVAFRLELLSDAQGSEKIYWHGLVDGKPEVFDVGPYTGYWKRFGVDLTKILPIEFQI